MVDGLSTKLLVFLSALVLFSIGASVEEPIFSRYVATFTPNPIAIGALLSLGLVTYAMFSAPAGLLCDKVGCRRVLLAGATLHPFAYLLWFSAPNIVLLACASLIAGFGSALFWSAARTYVVNLTSRKHMGIAYGAYHAGWSMGWSLGPLLGGFLALGAITTPFLAGAAVTSAAGLILGKTVGEFERNGKKRLAFRMVRRAFISHYSFSEGLKFLRHISPRSRWLLSLGFLFNIFWSTLYAFFPLLFTRYDNFQIGALFFAGNITYAASVLAAGRLVDRYDKRSILLAGMATTLVVALLFLFSTSFPEAMLYMLLIGVTSALMYPAIDALLMSHIPKAHRGAASGFALTSYGFGTVTGPLVGGAIAAVFGYANAILFGIAVAAAAAVYTAHVLRAR
jgi:DHA1 family multidrug resistance protein-like MFS transporter